MERTRPTSVTVIAILNLVFGGLSLLLLICGGAMTLGGGGKGMGGQADPKVEQLQKDLEAAQRQRFPASDAFSYGNIGLELIVCGLLIVSGIGLLRLQSWGRLLSLIYPPLSLLEKVISLVWIGTVWIPAVQEVVPPFKGTATPEQQRVATIMEMTPYGAGIVTLLTAIYPIIVLVIMLRPAVAAAFRGEAPGPTKDEPLDYDDRRDQPADGDRWGG
jgi:hypothetical protein